jgi:hypothetical protein
VSVLHNQSTTELKDSSIVGSLFFIDKKFILCYKICNESQTTKELLMPQGVIESLMSSLAGTLVNEDEEVCSALAEMNADGFGLDEFDDLKAVWANQAHTEVNFSVEISLSGEARDAAFSGDELDITLKGVAKLVRGTWQVDEYEILSKSNNF